MNCNFFQFSTFKVFKFSAVVLLENVILGYLDSELYFRLKIRTIDDSVVDTSRTGSKLAKVGVMRFKLRRKLGMAV